MNDTRNEPKTTEDQESMTLLQVAGSVIAAGFGVQSQENKRRDFSRGKAWQFIVVGILFTVGFLATMLAIVYLVLQQN